MTVDSDTFRTALGRFPSGVTIVTSGDMEAIHGMTVSAFASVSLDPPLVLVCLANGMETTDLIAETGRFGVCILEAGQEDLSNRFAMEDPARRFEGVAWETGSAGVPLLEGALASLECWVWQTIPAGDHAVVIGEVKTATVGDGEPLVYSQSGYRALLPPA